MVFVFHITLSQFNSNASVKLCKKNLKFTRNSMSRHFRFNEKKAFKLQKLFCHSQIVTSVTIT